ncbi:MAG: DNA cytosine methyltransferase [Myxococcota bacterium]
MSRRQPRIISLYTGAGGMDYGFEAAGFRTAVAVEMNHDCCETLRRNRRFPVIESSIFDVASEVLLETAGLKHGEADLLIGGPPCQPFSKSGYWATGDSRRLDDPRADTLSAYLRVLEETQPAAFVLENVTGIAYSGKSEGLDLLVDAVRQINRRTGSRYEPVYKVINAATYGVPQIRERFFMVAARDGTTFKFPAATHGEVDHDAGGLFQIVKPYVRAWDALAGLMPEPEEDLAMRGKWADLLPTIPEGQNYLWHTERGGGEPLFGWRRRFWTFLLKLAKALPSWTIQAQPGPAVGPFHWDNRRLSVRELCRLQTFPDDVIPVGGRTSIQKQVGNAVPSLLTEVLGRAIRAQLLEGGGPRGELSLLPRDRGDPPPPRKPSTVPRRFLRQRSRDTAHPGTGKGRGAVARAQESAL